MKITQYSESPNHMNDHKIINLIDKDKFDKLSDNPTDQDIYDYYGITKKEQKLIEEIVSDEPTKKVKRTKKANNNKISHNNSKTKKANNNKPESHKKYKLKKCKTFLTKDACPKPKCKWSKKKNKCVRLNLKPPQQGGQFQFW